MGAPVREGVWAALAFACAATLLSTPSLAQFEKGMVFSTDPDTVQNRMARITFDNGQHRIYATGEIREGSAKDLRTFAATHNITSAKVLFNSPGGSLIGGLRLGQAIRELEFDTAIGTDADRSDHPPKSVCASACAYAFAGGVRRYLSEDGALGVHQFSGGDGNPGTLEQGQSVSGLIVSYLDHMGVDASAFALSTVAKSDEMVWLSVRDAERLGFANNGRSPTTAEIKLAGRDAYLRLEQTQDDATSRVILFCDGRRLLVSAGIVTDPETSRNRAEVVTRSYIEIDGKPIQAMEGRSGVEAQDSVLWVRRALDAEGLRRLVSASELDTWTENGSAFRWGAQMDVSKVRPQIVSFVRNCLQ